MTPVELLIAAMSTDAGAVSGSQASDALPMTTVYTGDDGLTHFADGEIPLIVRDFSPPAPPVSVSDWSSASGVAFGIIAADWDGDWHPAPRRQFVAMMRGTIEIETGDGEKRPFAAGSAYLLTDLDGQGHRARVLGGDAATIALISVPA